MPKRLTMAMLIKMMKPMKMKANKFNLIMIFIEILKSYHFSIKYF
jgi:hypothetical protein